MNSLRIAMILDNAFNPDQRVLREARTLLEAGHYVTIFAWNREESSKLPDNENIEDIDVRRIRVPTGKQLGLKQVPKYLDFLIHLLRVESFDKYDVIHCHDLPSLVIGAILKIIKKKTIIYDAHEIYWIMESHKYPSAILRFIKYFEICLLKFADSMVTVSGNRFDYYKYFYKKNCVIIGNWYDAKNKDEKKRNDFRKQNGISPESFVISYTGTLDKSRSIDVLVECARQLKEINAPVDWVIAGSGVLESFVKESSAQNPAIHYLGWMEDLTALYSSTDALIYLMEPDHPYTDFNSPNNLFLSIAWRIPLIAISRGDIAETLSADGSGVLIKNVSPSSIIPRIINLYSKKNEYNNICSNLLKLQETYNWQICAQRLVSLYNGLNPSA